MKKVILIGACVAALFQPAVAAAQATEKPKTPEQVAKEVAQAQAIKTKIDDAQAMNPRFVRTLTNVQIELTLTDQIGDAAPLKKTVVMIVSSGTWGKIRASADPRMPQVVGLNVDARPFVSIDGPIQVELTLYYYPPRDPKADRLTELNQSLTVVLQSGKPLMISQSADPGGDRKVTVEAKATVLK